MSPVSRALVAVVALLGTSAVPALSQIAVTKNTQIEIEYVAPHSPQFQDIYERLKARQILEAMQEFLAPLRLPKRITVKADECGAPEILYKPQQPVIICYEQIRQIERRAPTASVVRIGPDTLTKDSIIIGGQINLVLSQIAYAIFDLLEIPIWGRMEDAADSTASLIMLEFDVDAYVVVSTLTGTSWFLAQRSFSGGGDFLSVLRGTEAQRYYNFTCTAYGAYPNHFRFLMENDDLPKNRAQSCTVYYAKIRRSFRQAIMPFFDQELLKQTRAIDWRERLRMPLN